MRDNCRKTFGLFETILARCRSWHRTGTTRDLERMKKFEERMMFTEVALLRVAGEDRQHDHLGRGPSPANTPYFLSDNQLSRKGEKEAVSIK